MFPLWPCHDTTWRHQHRHHGATLRLLQAHLLCKVLLLLLPRPQQSASRDQRQQQHQCSQAASNRMGKQASAVRHLQQAAQVPTSPVQTAAMQGVVLVTLIPHLRPALPAHHGALLSQALAQQGQQQQLLLLLGAAPHNIQLPGQSAKAALVLLSKLKPLARASRKTLPASTAAMGAAWRAGRRTLHSWRCKRLQSQ